MDQTLLIIFNLAVLIFSIVIHEVSHGLAAYKLGDPTAKQLGRLSLNPIKHLDFTGSFLVPLISYFFGGFVFGWAKPVPYNPYNIKNQKWGPAMVAAAGPASNFIVALVFGLGARFAGDFPSAFGASIAMTLICYINLMLGVFNLMPVPPLDGSKILAPFLPYKYETWLLNLERYGLFLVFVFILFLFPIIAKIIPPLFRLITGFSSIF